MTDQDPAPRRIAPARGILVTGASGTEGLAVLAALHGAGESVVAGMRDPRAWLAEGARRASGTAAGRQPGTAGPRAHDPSGGPGPLRPGGTGPLRPGGTGPVRPGGKPDRAPNQKPDRNPAAKPGRQTAAASAGRTIGRPGGAAGPTAAARRGAPDARSGSEASVAAGAVVRGFDFADRGTWARALAGVDRVFFTLPPTVDVGRSVIPFIDQAMEQAGVRQIVFLSAPGARLDPRSPHHLVELYLKRTRTPFTILRPTILMQTLTTLYRDDIRLRGELVLPAAGASAAFVDAADVGRVAARVLTGPRHLGKTYALAGEQSLSFEQVAGLLSAELDRTIRYTATSPAEFAELAAKQGARAADVAAQAAWYRAMRRPLTALPNRSILRLTGRPATTLRDFVAEHRQTWL
jgi:uncharacterized protein YbjT (DUF2867 family)